MKVKADLHNHLGRKGKFPNFNKVIDIASNRLGEEGIFSITNCDDYRYENFISGKGYEREDFGNFIYVPKKRISVIKSQEVFTKGHLLIIGLPNRKNIKNKIVEDTIKEAKEKYNSIIIANHPFYKSGIGNYMINHPKSRDFILDNIDSWEVYNASAEFWFPNILPKNANQKSVEFYEKEIKNDYNIGACSFTDGHSPKVIGRSYTIIRQLDRENAQSLINSLRSNIKSVKDFKYLHRESNITDTLVHAIFMFKDQITKKLLKR